MRWRKHLVFENLWAGTARSMRTLGAESLWVLSVLSVLFAPRVSTFDVIRSPKPRSFTLPASSSPIAILAFLAFHPRLSAIGSAHSIMKLTWSACLPLSTLEGASQIENWRDWVAYDILFAYIEFSTTMLCQQLQQQQKRLNTDAPLWAVE